MQANDQGDGKALARRQLRMLIARGELAEARAERMMASCAAEAAEVRASGANQILLDRHAWRTSTLLGAERMLQAPLPDEVDLSETFERYATHHLIASDLMTELRTTSSSVLVGGEVCRWVMLVAAELLHAVESAADPDHGCKAAASIEHREDGLLLRVASVDGLDRPVPGRSGTTALARVAGLMRLFGGFGSSVVGRDVVYEATFSGRRVCLGS